MSAATPESGTPVAQRAVHRVRLLAVALLLFGAVGHRPADGGLLGGQGAALALAAGAAGLLLTVSAVSARVGRAHPSRAARAALVAAACDALVVLGVVCLAGLPPRSFVLVLLLLPLLEAALWAGLAGLAGTWVGCVVVLGGYTAATAGPRLAQDLAVLVAALPVLLLATVPLALLTEHLVAEVAGLQEARHVADDRAALLAHVSAVTAELFGADLRAVAGQVVIGAQQLGATTAVLTTSGGQVLAAAGDPSGSTAPWEARLPWEDGEPSHDGGAGPQELTWQVPLAGPAEWELRVVLPGEGDAVMRRREALGLLAAQGGAALANAALVERLAHLRATFEDQATRDQLTGLVNRRGLAARTAPMTGRLGVLFCDLDGFKAVNDVLGHAAGDELLRQVAHRLEAVVGARGVLGRLGGDEFVAVVPGESDDGLARLAGAVHAAMTTPFALRAGSAAVGVSIGVARADDGARDLEGLLQRADERMYAAKRERRAVPGPRPTAPAADPA